MTYFKNNKSFIILLLLNTLYIGSLIDINRVTLICKNNIKNTLAKIGIEKYQKRLKLHSKNVVIYFNMDKSIKIASTKQIIKSYKNFTNELIQEPSMYKWGGEIV